MGPSQIAARILLIAACFIPAGAWAATFYVENTIADPTVLESEARAATEFVRNSVASRPGDLLVEDEFRADYILRPKMLKLGDSYIFTVEKRRGNETLFAAQSKIAQIDDLDRAARSSTFAAIDQPTATKRPPQNVAGRNVPPPAPAVPYQVYKVPPENSYPVNRQGSVSGATSGPDSGFAQSQAPYPEYRDMRMSHWSVGIGPFVPRHLDSNNVMYNLAVGHVWNLNPMASVKVLGEAALSSGGEDTQFFNFGAGASYFFPGQITSAPFITGDIGYGFVQNADGNDGEGFSLGAGVGYQFFRNTETTMDLLLRYAVVFDSIDGGPSDPSIIGLRLAVNF